VRRGRHLAWLVVCLVSASARPGYAQALTYRGFIDVRGVLFPQDAANDERNAVVDLLAREEAFLKLASWIQFAGGIDLRANSHEQVERSWSLDVADRTSRRPAISVRRMAATLTRGRLTVDVGKQFIRWGKADIVTPTDRFAPRDFLNVIDAEFLAVRGARAVFEAGAHTLDAVWVPVFTPSRLPLLDQRWTAGPGDAAAIDFVDAGAAVPGGAQAGVRWGFIGRGFEFSASWFDGFNHLPSFSIDAGTLPPVLRRSYPSIRSYGGDAAVPTRWFTIKGEAAYLASPDADADDYVLYVVQLERQSGEWLLVGGYAGEHVTARRALLSFAPDRGLTRSLVARGSYTIDTNRSAAFETTVRQNGDGVYLKGEYSQAHGAHLRTTVSGAVIQGKADDFLGQYRRNSHMSVSGRYSF